MYCLDEDCAKVVCWTDLSFGIAKLLIILSINEWMHNRYKKYSQNENEQPVLKGVIIWICQGAIEWRHEG